MFAMLLKKEQMNKMTMTVIVGNLLIGSTAFGAVAPAQIAPPPPSKNGVMLREMLATRDAWKRKHALRSTRVGKSFAAQSAKSMAAWSVTLATNRVVMTKHPIPPNSYGYDYELVSEVSQVWTIQLLLMHLDGSPAWEEPNRWITPLNATRSVTNGYAVARAYSPSVTRWNEPTMRVTPMAVARGKSTSATQAAQAAELKSSFTSIVRKYGGDPNEWVMSDDGMPRKLQ